MKRIIKFGLIFSVVMCICACGKETKNENVVGSNQEASEIETTVPEVQSSEETTTIDGFLILPTEEKIVKDINEFEKVTFVINTGSYKLETKSVKIKKAAQDDKKYTVYCNATQEDENYKAENYYLLVYNYYDIGGWVLDECTIQEKNIVPINACDMQFTCNNLQAEFNLTKCDYVKLDKVSDTEYVYYFKGIREYKYMDEHFDLITTCYFDKETGWHCVNDYTDHSEDWSRIYGTWYGEKYINGDYLENICTVEIKDIDAYRDIITFYIEVGHTSGSITKPSTIVTKPAEMTIDYGHTDDWCVSELDYALHCVETKLQTNFGGVNLETYCCIYFDENYGLQMVNYDAAYISMSKVQ